MSTVQPAPLVGLVVDHPISPTSQSCLRSGSLIQYCRFSPCLRFSALSGTNRLLLVLSLLSALSLTSQLLCVLRLSALSPNNRLLLVLQLSTLAQLNNRLLPQEGHIPNTFACEVQVTLKLIGKTLLVTNHHIIESPPVQTLAWILRIPLRISLLLPSMVYIFLL